LEAPIAFTLPAFGQPVEGAESFFQRRRLIVLMRIIKVDRLDTEAPQACLRRAFDMRRRKALVIADLGGDPDVTAASALPEPRAEQPLRFAAFMPRHPGRIDVRRVDHRPARFGEAIEDAKSFGTGRGPAEDIAAEHEAGRGKVAIAQGADVHCDLLPFRPEKVPAP